MGRADNFGRGLRRSDLWRIFRVTDSPAGLAQCSICFKDFSYRGTSSNLAKHLKRMHPDLEFSVNTPQKDANRVPAQRRRAASKVILCAQTGEQVTYEVAKEEEHEEFVRPAKRKTSPLWHHFSALDKKKAKCHYCPQTISFTRGSIGNLRRHMKAKHPTTQIVTPLEPQSYQLDIQEETLDSTDEETDQIENVDIAPTDEPLTIHHQGLKSCTQSSTEGFMQSPTRPKRKSEKIDRQLVIMMAKEYHPLRLVEGKEFQKFVQMLSPGYSLPTRKNLSENLLPELYTELFEKVQKKVSAALAVCLTTDTWTSINNESFIAVTAHFIDEETKLCSNLLDCVAFHDSHASVNMLELLKEKTTEWDIADKVVAVVSDNASNIAATNLGEWQSIACFAHLVNLVVQAGIAKISKTITKVKTIVDFIKRSAESEQTFQEIQKLMELPILKLKQDVSTRWNSTFVMLERIAKTKEAFIATVGLVWSDLSLSTDDWAIIEKVVPILEVFYEIISDTCTEKTVSLSKVIIYCAIMNKSINKYLEQPVRIPEIKELLTELQSQLKKRFTDIESHILYAESTILDPRFKKKGFTNERKFDKAFSELKLKIGSLPLPASTPAITCSDSRNDDPLCSRVTQSRKESIWDDFDNDVSRLIPQNPISAGLIEMDKYMAEAIISRKEDPLLWWHERKLIYPRLYAYMLKRLCLVATSVPCEVMFSKAGVVLNDRRTRLSSDNVSQLVFVNSNSE